MNSTLISILLPISILTDRNILSAISKETLVGGGLVDPDCVIPIKYLRTRRVAAQQQFPHLHEQAQAKHSQSNRDGEHLFLKTFHGVCID